jgi:hypothetical protein
MSVPNEVLDRIAAASFFNHGANLAIGDKTYSLTRRGNGVKARLFVSTDGDVGQLEKTGFTIGHKVAWKKISTRDIPTRPASDWDVWDEY